MANELQAQTDSETGLNAYFILKDTIGQVWNGTSFVAYTSLDRDTGAITATGLDDGSYVADIPAGVSAGLYYYDLFAHGTGTGTGIAAETDELLCAGGVVDWNGTTVISLNDVPPSVWDVSLGSHLNAGSTGYYTSLLVNTIIAATGQVVDNAATTTSFNTNLGLQDNFYNDMILVFTSGALQGQARPIRTSSSSGALTFDEGFTTAPANGTTFNILVSHVHPITQIANEVWTTVLTEAYRATGAEGTAVQLLYEIIAHLGNSSIASTLKTLTKLDKATTAKTYTLDSATAPTAIEETT